MSFFEPLASSLYSGDKVSCEIVSILEDSLCAGIVIGILFKITFCFIYRGKIALSCQLRIFRRFLCSLPYARHQAGDLKYVIF